MDTTLASTLTVSLVEAVAYLAKAKDDELAAAIALAEDRELLQGSCEEPDEVEVHHALYLLRRARGLEAPSFDDLRVSLRKARAAATAKAASAALKQAA